jgi:hypothetical protein
LRGHPRLTVDLKVDAYFLAPHANAVGVELQLDALDAANADGLATDREPL